VLNEMVLTEEVGFQETSSGAVVADGTRLSAGASELMAPISACYLCLNSHESCYTVGVSFGKQGRYGGTSQEFTEAAGKFSLACSQSSDSD
jgi:hypothetical protein